MSKNNENKFVPRLRFPEFMNDGEWIYPNGDELFEPIVNKNHNSDLPILAITQERGAIPRDMIDYHVSVTEKSIESYKVVEVGDFIISLRSFQGGIEYSNYKGLCSPAYIILRKKVEIKNDFYRHYFKSVPFIRDLNKNLEGIRDGKMISYKQFSEILIPKPNPKEQQKIASCLSSLDELLTAERKKLEVLKEHKKGLLQNLFPKSRLNCDSSDLYDEHDSKNQGNQENQKNQGSDNVPKLRFKEFEDSGEWVEKKLGEVAIKVGSGSTPLGGESVYKKNGRPFVRSQNVGWGIFILENIAFIDEETHQNSINTEIQFEDVLLNITGASIGRSAVANEFVKGGNVNQHVCIIRTEKDILNPVFLNQFLISDFGQKQIDSFQAGGNRQGLNFVQIRSLSISIPPAIQEQQKIASTLSSIDELITAQTQKIEALQLHKKGLLQGLFPNLNEVPE